MIRACPICGTDYGLTHGDQTFVSEVCEECQALEEADEERKAQLKVDQAIETDVDAWQEAKNSGGNYA